MKKFKVMPIPRITNKTQFLCQLDVDMQHWVRCLAAANGLTIQNVVQQVFQYAKDNSEPMPLKKRK